MFIGDRLKIIEENEKVSFCTKVLNNVEAAMIFDFEKTSRYRSFTLDSEVSDENLVNLELFEINEYITRMPGCRLRWRARFFRDTYQEPHQHSVSLQLLSCELEGQTDVTRVEATCWLDGWENLMLTIEFDPCEVPLVPINESIVLNARSLEEMLLEDEYGETIVNLNVHVRAQFQLNDSVLLTCDRGDFAIQRPTKLAYDEEENVVSLHKKSFCMFNNITVRSFRFEKFAKYPSSDDLKLFQSRQFITDVWQPDSIQWAWRMFWRVRYFRDTFKNPIGHSLGLQLQYFELKHNEQLHAHVTCELRINDWRLKSALVADFGIGTGPLKMDRIVQLNGNQIEELLTSIEDEFTVGLVVEVQIYQMPDNTSGAEKKPSRRFVSERTTPHKAKFDF